MEHITQDRAMILMMRHKLALHTPSTKSSWSKAEDELLVQAVAKWGPHDWYQIASEIPGRLPRQCRERYKNHLRQGINTSPFTPEEDAIILTAQGWCLRPAPCYPRAHMPPFPFAFFFKLGWHCVHSVPGTSQMQYVDNDQHIPPS